MRRFTPDARVMRASAEEKRHYKLYKKGKAWVTAGITVVAAGVVLGQRTSAVRAAGTETGVANVTDSSATKEANRQVVVDAAETETEAASFTATAGGEQNAVNPTEAAEPTDAETTTKPVGRAVVSVDSLTIPVGISIETLHLTVSLPDTVVEPEWEPADFDWHMVDEKTPGRYQVTLSVSGIAKLQAANPDVPLEVAAGTLTLIEPSETPAVEAPVVYSEEAGAEIQAEAQTTLNHMQTIADADAANAMASDADTIVENAAMTALVNHAKRSMTSITDLVANAKTISATNPADALAKLTAAFAALNTMSQELVQASHMLEADKQGVQADVVANAKAAYQKLQLPDGVAAELDAYGDLIIHVRSDEQFQEVLALIDEAGLRGEFREIVDPSNATFKLSPSGGAANITSYSDFSIKRIWTLTATLAVGDKVTFTASPSLDGFRGDSNTVASGNTLTYTATSAGNVTLNVTGSPSGKWTEVSNGKQYTVTAAINGTTVGTSTLTVKKAAAKNVISELLLDINQGYSKLVTNEQYAYAFNVTHEQENTGTGLAGSQEFTMTVPNGFVVDAMNASNDYSTTVGDVARNGSMTNTAQTQTDTADSVRVSYTQSGNTVRIQYSTTSQPMGSRFDFWGHYTTGLTSAQNKFTVNSFTNAEQGTYNAVSTTLENTVSANASDRKANMTYSRVFTVTSSPTTEDQIAKEANGLQFDELKYLLKRRRSLAAVNSGNIAQNNVTFTYDIEPGSINYQVSGTGTTAKALLLVEGLDDFTQLTSTELTVTYVDGTTRTVSGNGGSFYVEDPDRIKTVSFKVLKLLPGEGIALVYSDRNVVHTTKPAGGTATYKVTTNSPEFSGNANFNLDIVDPKPVSISSSLYMNNANPVLFPGDKTRMTLYWSLSPTAVAGPREFVYYVPKGFTVSGPKAFRCSGGKLVSAVDLGNIGPDGQDVWDVKFDVSAEDKYGYFTIDLNVPKTALPASGTLLINDVGFQVLQDWMTGEKNNQPYTDHDGYGYGKKTVTLGNHTWTATYYGAPNPWNYKILVNSMFGAINGIDDPLTGAEEYLQYDATNEQGTTAHFSRGATTSTSDDKNSASIRLSTVNTNPLSSPWSQNYVNLPSTAAGDAFTLNITGPATINTVSGTATGANVLYSTSRVTSTGTKLNESGWKTAAQVTDWSQIKAVLLRTDKMTSNTVVTATFKTSVANINSVPDGTAVTFISGLIGEYGDGSLVANTTKMRAQVVTSRDVQTQWVKRDDNGNETVIKPAQTATYQMTERYTTSPLAKADIPAGYVLLETPKNASGLVADATPNAQGVIVVKYVYTLPQQKTIVKYVDADNGNAVLKTDNLSHSANYVLDYASARNAIQADLISRGYVFDRTDLPTNNKITFDDNDAVDQTFTVYFKHGTKPVTKDLTKSIKRTITYVYEDGTTAAPNKIDTVTFTRTGVTDTVTNETTYTDWTSTNANYAAVTSPTVAGFTPDKTNVPAGRVAVTDTDSTVKVTYKADTQTVIIHYIDVDASTKPNGWQPTDGKEVTAAKQTKTGGSKTTYTNTITIPQNYQLASGTVTNGSFDAGAKSGTFDTDKTVDQNYYVYLKHASSQATDDLTKTIKRTITYVYEDGTTAKPSTTQEVTFTRTGKVDAVTGTTTYTDWTSTNPNYAAVTSPTIAGYTPDKANVATARVTATDTDSTVKITYKADTQTVIIHYIDVDGSSKPSNWTPADGTEVTAAKQTKTGKSATEYTNTITVPNKYVLAAGTIANGSFDAGAKSGTFDKDTNTDQNYYVYLKHASTEATDDLKKIITRTITYVYEDGSTAGPTKTQDVIFTRTGTVDSVTGRPTYTEWTSTDANFAAVTTPTLSGYTPDKATVAAARVTATDQNASVKVTYVADEQTVTIHYIDVDGASKPSGWKPTDGTEVTAAKQTKTGKSKTTYTNTITLPSGYVLASGTLANGSFDAGAKGGTFDTDSNTDQDYYVYLKHDATDATDDLTKTISRTIKYVFENGETAQPDKTQEVTFTRTGKVDAVTGEITYTDWTSTNSTYAAVTSPTVSGYTPDKATVETAAVTATDTDATVTVTYRADGQTVYIHYIDVAGSNKPNGWTPTDGKEVTDAKQRLTGKSDTAYTNRLAIPDNYVLASGTVTSGSFDPEALSGTFDADTSADQHFYVYLKHDEKAATDDLTKTITRTITYVYADGTTAKPSEKQEVTFTRTGTVDSVTGEPTYTEWTSTDPNYAAKTVPTVDGYTPDKTTVEAARVAATDTDSTVTVTYTADDQKVIIHYIDVANSSKPYGWQPTDGVEVPAVKQTLTGKSLATYTNTLAIPNGYQLASGTPTSGSFDAGAIGGTYDTDKRTDQNYYVYLKHSNTEATDNLSKTIKRTITYVYENGNTAQPPVTQEVTFTRTGTVDAITGEVTYTEWESADPRFATVTTPTLAGYTPDKQNVEAARATATDTDSTVTVTYAADTQTVFVHYIDVANSSKPSGWEPGDGTEVIAAKQRLTGKSTARYTNTLVIPTGYELAVGTPTSGSFDAGAIGGTYDADSDADQHYYVYLKHASTDATDDLTKTVTRTITYAFANGRPAKPDVTQTVTFTRTGKVDSVTGAITYTDWTSTNPHYSSVTSPTISGYTPDLPTVADAAVTATDANSTVRVTYTANGQQVMIHYIDVDGSSKSSGWRPTDGVEVDSALQALSGQSGAAYTNRLVIPNNYIKVGSDAEAEAGTYDTNDNVDQNYYVYLKHDKKPVDHTDRGDNDPSDFEKIITETIHYVFADGRQAAQDVTAQVKFYRTGIEDQVTGVTTWNNDWATADGATSTSFEAVTSPTIPGYTPNHATVAETPITPTGSDVVYTVTYTAGRQMVRIQYIDVNGSGKTSGWNASDGTIVNGATQTLTGETGGTYTNELRLPNGYVLAAGDLTNGSFDAGAKGGTYDDDDSVDQTFNVYLKHAFEPVHPGDPDFDPMTMTKTITRTITYVLPNGDTAAPTATDTVTFNQGAKRDKVTGEVILTGEWTPATTDTFTSVTSPNVNGYTPDKTIIDGQRVTHTSTDLNFTVTYLAEGQKVYIHYIDVDGSTRPGGWTPADGVEINAARQALSGESGASYTNTLNIPTNYVAAGSNYYDAGAVSGTYDTDSNVDQNFYVYLKHDTKSVDHTDRGDNDPSAFEKTVNETIHYVYADGTQAAPDASAEVKFYRTGVEDLVTHETKWNDDWATVDGNTTYSFPAVTSPTIQGFAADHTTIGTSTVEPNSADVTYTVTYTAADQRVRVHYIDVYGSSKTSGWNQADGTEITAAMQTLNGKTGAHYTNTLSIPSHYQLAAGTLSSGSFDAGAIAGNYDHDESVDQDFYVYLTHSLLDITPDNPQGTDPTKLKQTVTEAITYVYTDGTTAAKPVNATVTFTQTGTLDQVTGEVTYHNDWTAVNGKDSFDAVYSPLIQGALADTAVVEAITGLTKDSANVTKTVTYTRLGAWIPDAPGQHLPNIDYPGDPTDPTKPLSPTDPNYPVIPFVPGFTPQDPTTHQPLVPVDPTTPESGYVPPVIPSDPSHQTHVEYTANDQKLIVNYIDDADGSVIETGQEIGKSGEQSTYSTAATIAALKAKGYTLISDGFPRGGITFDTNDYQDQIYTVHFGHGSITFTPETPGNPGTPIHPGTTGGPNWPNGIGESDLSTTVRGVVHYVFADGTTAKPDATDSVTFVHTVTVDTVTGTILSTTDWEAVGHDTTFDAVPTPMLEGYVANRSASKAITDIKATDNDYEQTITYTKMAAWVPNLPGMENITYPNNPTDPTGPANPNSPDYPVIPFVPGYTPQGPNGQDLTPVDPDDPTQGYLPPTPPADLSTDTDITYVADKQTITIVYIDDETGATITTDHDTGDSGALSTYSTAGKIAQLTRRGYELVSDGFPSGGVTFDNDKTVDQTFSVHFKHTKQTFDPSHPGKPGEPLNPSDPNSPLTPDEAGKDALTKIITETVQYKFEEGGTAADDAKQTVTFTRSVVVDNVTGQVVEVGEWKAVDDDTTWDAIYSPLVEGYVADKIRIDAVTGLTGDSRDITFTVYYGKLGVWYPNIEGMPSIKYPNDATDPGKTLDPADPNFPIIPHVPGYTPLDPEGNALTPIDPDDASKGYYPPVVPADPRDDTPIKYVPNQQLITVSYIDDETGEVIQVDRSVGFSDTKSPYSTTPTINALLNKGYILVSDNFPDGGVLFDADDDNDQTFEVHLKHGTVTVTPDEPGIPGHPINPNDPAGPQWPEGSDKNGLTAIVTQTVHYVFRGGKTAAPDKTDKVSFWRNAVVDKVTGLILSTTEWTAVGGDTTFDAKLTPVVKGYVADKKQIDAITDITAESDNDVQTVTYSALGFWKPDFPGLDDIQYPNDPDDPTGTLDPNAPNFPAIPYVPGYTPQDPNGKPLELIDPNDPEKGYRPPAIPADPTDSTVLHYTANKQVLTVTYIDDTTGKTLATDTDEGVSDGKSTYSTAKRIAAYAKLGYELVSSDYPDGGATFDTNDAVDQAYTVHLKHKTSTVTPDKPGKPGAPIDPSNPNGPKYPDGVEKDDLQKVITQTIHYKYADGTTAAKDVVDAITFSRTGTIDWITGELTYSDWSADNEDRTWDEKVSPKIEGYTPDRETIPAISDLTIYSKDMEETVTYHSDTELPDTEGEGDKNDQKPDENGGKGDGSDGNEGGQKPGDNGDKGDTNGEGDKTPGNQGELPNTDGQTQSGNGETTTTQTTTVTETVTNGAAARNLPQTGEETNAALGLAGAALMGGLGLLAGAKKRKRDEDNA